MKKSFLLGIVACVQAFAAVLSPSGKEYTEIVVDAKAPAFVKFAAGDLARCIEKTSGTKLAVVNEHSGRKPAIFVGKSRYTDELGVTADGVASEGFRIVSKADYLAIVGRDYSGEPVMISWRHPWRATEVWSSDLGFGLFGEQGTMNGVYSFLKSRVGMRWYMPGEDGEVAQPVDTLRIPEFSMTDAPVFPQRYIYYSLAGVHSDDLVFMRRNGQGGLAPFFSMHNFDLMLKYKDTHPEYFALIDGQRDFDNLCCIGGGGHLCLTNPEVVKVFAKEVCDYFDKNPLCNSFPVFPMDGLVRLCSCPNCQAEIDNDAPDDGKFSNHIWGFVAKVATEVEKTHPGKIIACAAYEKYRNPPSKIPHLPKNVAIDLVYSRDYSLVPAQNEMIHRQFEGWKERTSNIYTWVHYLLNNGAWQGLPVGTPRLVHDEVKYLHDIKVWKGEMIEAEGKDIYALNNPGMANWKIYLTMLSHWNPDYDVTAVMDEYYRLFYGPAAAQMKTFWESAFKGLEEAGRKTKNKVLLPDEVYTLGLLTTMNEAINAAKKAVPKDSVYARRVDMVDKEFQYGRGSLVGFIQDGKREMDVPKISSEKELDGLEKKRFVARDGAPYVPNTWVVTARDDNDFIMRFYCYDDDMKSLKTAKREHDAGEIWGDELLEIFLCINPNDDAFALQFAVNPSGTIWDARYGIGLHSSAWNSETARATGSIEEHRWVLTMRVSLKELGYDKFKPGDRIKAEFYRARQVGKTMEYSNWSPVFQPSNYYPSRFGTLIWK